MTPIHICIPESTDNKPRDLYRYGSLGVLIVTLLYERKWTDLIKINCCLNVPFIIWFLCVELGNVWDTVRFMQSVHLLSRTHGIFITVRT